MNLQELLNLIGIREYVVNSVNNCSIDRPTVKELGGILILLDNKIISILKSPEFKDYIGYADVRQAIIDVANITNIKSSLNKPKF